MARRPTLGPAAAVGQCVGRLQIPVRLLRRQNFGNPVFQRRLHLLLSLDDFRITARVHHQGDAHGFYRLMHPRVRKHITFLSGMRLATQGFGSFDEIIHPALALSKIGSVDVVNAVRNPVHDHGLDPSVPKRAVNGVAFRIDHIEPFGLRWRHDLHFQCRGGAQFALARLQLKHVVARLGERRRCFGGVGIGEGYSATPGLFAPDRVRGAFVGFEQLNPAAQIRLSSKHHVTIHSCHDGRRKIRRRR